MLYFAYGSNLNKKQMRRRCPNSKLVGQATLKNYRLAFGGNSQKWAGPVATIIHSPGHIVKGILYRISQQDLKRLDAFEGHPSHYLRKSIVVKGSNGKKRKSFVYILPIEFEARPSQRYFRIIWNAYGSHRLDKEPLLATANKNIFKTSLIKVFVYGTLMKGEKNHRLLELSKFVGPGKTEPAFDFVNLGGFPAMIWGGVTQVVGEIYEVDNKTLARLDRLESHPDMYRREPIVLEDRTEVQAYVMRRDTAWGQKFIDSGSWREYRNSNDDIYAE